MKYFLIISIVLLFVISVVFYFSYRRNLYLFSEIKGLITINGKPVPYAEVSESATWNWNKEEFSFGKKTEKDGTFSFSPIISHSFFAGILPEEIRIKQMIRITYDNVTYDGWMHFKQDYGNLSEIEGGRLDVICELTNSKDYLSKKVPENGTAPYGICRLARP